MWSPLRDRECKRGEGQREETGRTKDIERQTETKTKP